MRIIVCVIVSLLMIAVLKAQERSIGGESGGRSIGSPGGLGDFGSISPGGLGPEPNRLDSSSDSYGSERDADKGPTLSSFVPAGSSCPPRCPNELASQFQQQPVPVLNWDERYKEIAAIIKTMKEDAHAIRSAQKAIEIAARSWILEYGVSETISSYARIRIADRAEGILGESLQKMAEAAISLQIDQLIALKPYFWDLRASSQEKRAILNDVENKLSSVNVGPHRGNDSASFKKVTMFRPAAGVTAGQILYKPGLAIRQAEKIANGIDWANQ